MVLVFGNLHGQSQDCFDLIRRTQAVQGKISKDSLIALAKQIVTVCNTATSARGYIVSLYYLSQVYKGTQYRDSSIKYARDAVLAYLSAGLTDPNLHAKLLLNFGESLEYKELPDYALTMYDSAKRVLAVQISIENQSSNQVRGTYIECLNSIGMLHTRLGHLYAAEDIFKDIFEKVKLYSLENSYIYIRSLNNYGGLLNSLNENKKAIDYYNRTLLSLTAYGSLHPIDSVFYSTVLNNLGYSSQNLGDYETAQRLYTFTLELRERLLSDSDELMLNIKNNIAALYLLTGRYTRGVEEYKKLEPVTSKFGSNSPVHLNVLNNLAYALVNSGEQTEGINVAKKYLELCRMNKKQDSASFAYALGNLGELYRAIKDLPNGQKYLDSSLLIYKKIKTADAATEIAFQNNLAMLFSQKRHYDKAISIYKNIYSTSLSKFPDDNERNIIYAKNLAAAYIKKGAFDMALPLIKTASGMARIQMRGRLGIMSEEEREKYVKQIDDIFQIFKSHIFKAPVKTINAYAGMIYDNELLLKSFVLSGDQKLRTAILNSPDTAIIALFSKWKDDKIALLKLQLRNNMKTAELEKQINISENKLVARIPVFEQIMTETNLTWRQIQHSLKKGQMIVDFVYYRDFTDDTKATEDFRYFAVVVTKDLTFPRIVPLFNEAALNELLKPLQKFDTERERINDIYGDADIENINAKNESLFRLIWKPILASTKNIHEIYFIPVKKLTSISLLALHDKHGFLIDSFNMTQLQNSNEIYFEKNRPHPDILKSLQKATDVALFGGIEYDSVKTFIANIPDNRKLDSSQFYEYLPYSKKETNDIDSLFTKIHILSTTYSGNAATEERVKSFDRNSPGILHIATHGFFSEQDSSRSGKTFNNMFRNLSNPFLRAGLLFAGANYTLGGGKADTGMEDGILTAEEAALLDFRNTKLLVLSACETGIGESRGSEGVFGLQRAFKISGVEYMVVSLWKISEQATSRFMVLFYQNMCDGNSIDQSFRKAQLSMKKEYNPYYWAGFTLVR